MGPSSTVSHSQSHDQQQNYEKEDEEEIDNDSQGTEVPDGKDDEGQEGDGVIDEVGAQDAFVAGMIYALSRRITPGAPYTPSAAGEDVRTTSSSSEAGKWRLDECLRCVDVCFVFVSLFG